MICPSCRTNKHQQCKKLQKVVHINVCDCQHRRHVKVDTELVRKIKNELH